MRLLASATLTAAIAAVCAAAPAAQAQLGSQPDLSQELPLDGEVLTGLFQDTLHRGYYELERWDGADPAFHERMGADGSAVHVQDGVTSVGEWRTWGNVVCFTYEELNGGCFNIYQRGTCYYAVSAQYGDLVAITYLDGTEPDCEPAYA